ncbi:VOC family protein [Porifericola rhodea]|uniref:VOC family protein n=1 Tax=Porifericola rhodea TaxID=930972 RepID=UPI0026659547|nr:VOC family protein [Porifericola rhodea]WKN31546.1 VOC family protein [Porifericola rhodea]
MKVHQIKENCLYVSDLAKTRQFYEKLMGFELISFVEGRHVFFKAGSSVLLCFLPEVTKSETKLPPHFAYGQQHLAFEVDLKEYEVWKAYLKEQNISILHEQHWKDNLYSFYFHDPDQHVLEILPPGIWE